MPRNTVVPAASTLTLPSDKEILIVRSFAAPRERVWRAFTDPKLVPKWYGPPGNPMSVCQMDVRPNGKFRWAWEADGKVLFATEGIFHQVEKPRLLVMESRAPDPTPEVRSMSFEESAGRTTLTIRIAAATKQIRDELLAMDMKEGMDAGFAQLDTLLASLR
jgi:uncharacterized protein YndB with AHSA1/START domain